MVKDQAVRHYLADALCEALFEQPGPTRLSVLVQALPEDVPCCSALALEIMESDDRFARCVTRWDLAHRASIGTRPFGGALEAILQTYGRPMPRAMLVSELCLSRPGEPPQFDELLKRLLQTGRDFASLDDYLILTRWLPNTAVMDERSQLFVNGLAADERFLAIKDKLRGAALKQRQVLDTAEAVLKAAKDPLPNQALGLILHHHHGDRFSPAETLMAMYYDERFLPLSGLNWTLRSQEKTYLRALAGVPCEAEEALAEVDMASVLLTPPSQKIKVDPQQLREAQELAVSSHTPVDIGELVTDVMGLGRRQRNFVPAAHVLENALGSDLQLIRIAPGRYLSRQALPPWVKTVPQTLVPEQVPLAPHEKGRDVLLPLEELAPGLTERVADPFYEDQGEVGISLREEAVAETVIPIACHHYRCGTMRLRAQDRRLYDQLGPIAVVTFVTPLGHRLPIWVNLETRLLYGFLTWYDQALPPCGALVKIQRDPDDRDTYNLLYEDEIDAGTYIGLDRLEQLEALRDRLRRKRAFAVDIVSAVLQGNKKGLAFDQLWAQMNVIRRSTRLLLASTLTVNEQFGESAGRWKIAGH